MNANRILHVSATFSLLALTVGLLGYGAWQYLKVQPELVVSEQRDRLAAASIRFHDALRQRMQQRLLSPPPSPETDLAEWARQKRIQEVEYGNYTLLRISTGSFLPSGSSSAGPVYEPLAAAETGMVRRFLEEGSPQSFLRQVGNHPDRLHRIGMLAEAGAAISRSGDLKAAISLYRELRSQAAGPPRLEYWVLSASFRLGELQNELGQTEEAARTFLSVIGEAADAILAGEEWGIFFGEKAIREGERLQSGTPPPSWEETADRFRQAVRQAGARKQHLETFLKETVLPAVQRDPPVAGNPKWFFPEPDSGLDDVSTVCALPFQTGDESYLVSLAVHRHRLPPLLQSAAEAVRLPEWISWGILNRDGTPLSATVDAHAGPPRYLAVTEPEEAGSPFRLGGILPGEAKAAARKRTLVYVIPLSLVALLMTAALVLLVRNLWMEQTLFQMKEELMAKASHHLKTPLGLLRLYVEALHNGQVRDEPRRREYLSVLKRECERLTVLADNLLSFSRLSRPHDDLPAGTADVIDLSKVVRRVTGTFHGTGLPVSPRLEEGIRIAAREIELENALYNLIDNALKYSPAGSPVEVTLEAAEGRARLSIRDRGPGFSEEDRKNLGQPFYRGRSAAVQKTRGLGLGLAIAREVIHTCGGMLSVENADGQGSAVLVTFPLYHPVERHD